MEGSDLTIKPHFSKFDPGRNAWIFGLDQEDLDKVHHGYACGECLEDYNGVWLPECPVCHNKTLNIVPMPVEWT